MNCTGDAAIILCASVTNATRLFGHLPVRISAFFETTNVNRCSVAFVRKPLKIFKFLRRGFCRFTQKKILWLSWVEFFLRRPVRSAQLLATDISSAATRHHKDVLSYETLYGKCERTSILAITAAIYIG